LFFSRWPGVMLQVTPVASPAALPPTALPVWASTTMIALSSMDAGSSEGENEARTFVVSATFAVPVDSLSASCEASAPMTVTEVSDGGCGTRACPT